MFSRERKTNLHGRRAGSALLLALIALHGLAEMGVLMRAAAAGERLSTTADSIGEACSMDANCCPTGHDACCCAGEISTSIVFPSLLPSACRGVADERGIISDGFPQSIGYRFLPIQSIDASFPALTLCRISPECLVILSGGDTPPTPPPEIQAILA